MPEIHATHTEPNTVSARPVLLTVIGFFVFVALCLVGLFYYFRADVGPRPFLEPRTFPAPRLQTSALTDLQTLLKQQREKLTAYVWVDKAQGIVRIPISRAMEIIAAKGEDGLAPLNPPPAPEQSASERAAQALRSATRTGKAPQ